MNELVGKEVWSVTASEWGVADTNAIFTTREKGVDYLHKEAKRCNWEILKEENEKGYTHIEIKAEDGSLFHFGVQKEIIH